MGGIILQNLDLNQHMPKLDSLYRTRMYFPNSKHPHHLTYGVLNNCLVGKNTYISYMTSLKNDMSTGGVNKLLSINKVNFSFLGPLNNLTLVIYDTSDTNIYDELRVCNRVEVCLPSFSVHLSLLGLGHDGSVVNLSKLDDIYDTLRVLNYATENYKTPNEILPPLSSIEVS